MMAFRETKQVTERKDWAIGYGDGTEPCKFLSDGSVPLGGGSYQISGSTSSIVRYLGGRVRRTEVECVETISPNLTGDVLGAPSAGPMSMIARIKGKQVNNVETRNYGWFRPPKDLPKTAAANLVGQTQIEDR